MLVMIKNKHNSGQRNNSM